MRTVYAFQCDIVPKHGQSGEECLEELIQTGALWVQDAMKRGGISNPAALDWSGKQVHYGPTVVGTASRERKADVDVATATWSHPNVRDDSLGFSHDIATARVGERLHFSYQMRVFTRDSKVKPTSFAVRTPQLVGKILSAFDCRIGTERIHQGYRTVNAVDVPAFVEQELAAESRTLPIIAVSPDKYSEKPLIDVERLSKLVVGLAHVVVLPDRWASFALTNELGKERSCFWGAVRIYWPGIGKTFDAFKQPLYLPPSIARKQEMNFPLEEELFRELRNIATFRVAENPLVREARAVLEKAASEEVDTLRRAVEADQHKSRSLHAFLEKTDAELSTSRDRIRTLGDEKELLETQLQQAIDDNSILKMQLEDKDKEIEALKRSFADIKTWQSSQVVATPENQPTEYKRVIDAYKSAEANFGSQLVFLDSARKAAEDSPYTNADSVYEAFEAIVLVAGDWAKGTLGKSIKDAFRELVGAAYRSDISQTTRSKFGSDYTFKYKDAPVLFERHVTLGAGDPECCLSIHMYFDEDDKVVVIGWCGRHLPNTKS